ncbi:MAG TPA: YggS family pyridoxal phosphate-dependent enzyme [Verrucomicrobiae bacterium]|jgi:pyridoxal phosphate enzyme (YggS family)|nr:YggS family pyridoxal phosphate-dependent enzyme [Verrucomicrobiae bacterium]
MESIAAKFEQLQLEVANAARKAGRDPASVRIVLVTKFVEPSRILEAYQAGARDFGENRIQEFQSKKDGLPTDIAWHLIGSLQSNKVKDAVGQAALIHSLDRPELAAEIDRQAAKRNIPRVPCLIQVNSSGEETKSGFEAGDVVRFLASLSPESRVEIKGFMTIGPLTQDEALIRASFRKVRDLQAKARAAFPRLDFGILSMGMSADYKIAIEEGSTLIRVGSFVFGSRPAKAA